MLRVHLIPKLHHRLVLSRTRGGVLRRLDKLVRRRVRSWVHLPHDATNTFIHADARDGGLGVSSLRTSIPFMKSDRLARLASSDDPVISHLVSNSAAFARECANCSWPPVQVGSVTVNSVTEARREQARQLHASADGYGLEASAMVPFVHSWVSDGTTLLTGASFVHAVQIKGATVSTRKRAARGRPLSSDRCDACGRIETLGHILQVCHRRGGPGSRDMTRCWRSCSVN